MEFFQKNKIIIIIGIVLLAVYLAYKKGYISFGDTETNLDVDKPTTRATSSGSAGSGYFPNTTSGNTAVTPSPPSGLAGSTPAVVAPPAPPTTNPYVAPGVNTIRTTPAPSTQQGTVSGGLTPPTNIVPMTPRTNAINQTQSNTALPNYV